MLYVCLNTTIATSEIKKLILPLHRPVDFGIIHTVKYRVLYEVKKIRNTIYNH